MPKAILVTTSDNFFLSHRLSLALALKRAGFEVAVAAESTGTVTLIESHGLRFIELPLDRRSMAPWREARVIAAIAAMYRRERPDLVHHSSIKPMIYGSSVARVLGLPAFVNTVSGLGYALTDRPQDGIANRALRLAAKAGYRIALRGHGCWNIFQNPDQLKRFVELGLADPNRSEVIRGAGVDINRFVPAPLPDGDPVVLLPARMLWDKGIGEFVEASRMLHRRRVKARFVLCGKVDPGSRAEIPLQTLQDWVREGVVEWWGHQENMPEVLSRAHLVVLPSYAEGLPLALAEAASAGRATITTDIPGCREVVISGQTGWLVPPFDAASLAEAIEQALSDRARLAAMGLKGREHAVAMLSQDRVLAETFRVFRKLGVPVPDRDSLLGVSQRT